MTASGLTWLAERCEYSGAPDEVRELARVHFLGLFVGVAPAAKPLLRSPGGCLGSFRSGRREKCEQFVRVRVQLVLVFAR